MTAVRFALPAITAALLAPVSLWAEEITLPDPTTGAFCQMAQRILASTDMEGTVEVFDNMPDYRASKPAPDPLMIYQVVTYDDKRPVAVSCKVKAADHLRDVYGEDAAGEQQRCAAMTEIALAQAIRELDVDNPPDVVERARGFVVDDAEPSIAGSQYLADFELSYVGEDGKIHIQSPGLQTDWENWMFWLFPDRVRGQTYCHLATVPYLKALATGAVEPGTVLTTADEAPTTPPGG